MGLVVCMYMYIPGYRYLLIHIYRYIYTKEVVTYLPKYVNTYIWTVVIHINTPRHPNFWCWVRLCVRVLNLADTF